MLSQTTSPGVPALVQNALTHECNRRASQPGARCAAGKRLSLLSPHTNSSKCPLPSREAAEEAPGSSPVPGGCRAVAPHLPGAERALAATLRGPAISGQQ